MDLSSFKIIQLCWPMFQFPVLMTALACSVLSKATPCLQAPEETIKKSREAGRNGLLETAQQPCCSSVRSLCCQSSLESLGPLDAHVPRAGRSCLLLPWCRNLKDPWIENSAAEVCQDSATPCNLPMSNKINDMAATDQIFPGCKLLEEVPQAGVGRDVM